MLAYPFGLTKLLAQFINFIGRAFRLFDKLRAQNVPFDSSTSSERRVRVGCVGYIWRLGCVYLLGSLLYLSSCATYVEKSSLMRAHLSQNNFTQALHQLPDISGDLGVSLTNLHTSILLRASGKYTASNDALEIAKQHIADTVATSISEQATSLVTNDEAISYTGAWFEQLLIYVYKALNYLDLDDIYAARVEMLQAQVLIKGWDEQTRNWYLVNYLAGIIYQMLGETDNAIISYRQAVLNIQDNAPVDLQRAFLRLLAAAARDAEYNKYSKIWNISVEDASTRKQANKGELILWLGSGLIGAKQSIEIYHHSPNFRHNLAIAVPSYPRLVFTKQTPHFTLDKQPYSFNSMAALDQLARATLKQEMSAIMAKTIARVIAKKSMENEMENPLAKLSMQIFNLSTEIADTRSWDSLPHAILTRRLLLEPGEYILELEGKRYSRQQKEIKVNIRKGKITFISLDNFN
jgi:uncharacterized protein